LPALPTHLTFASVRGADPTGYFSIAGSGAAIIQSAKAYIVELSLSYIRWLLSQSSETQLSLLLLLWRLWSFWRSEASFVRELNITNIIIVFAKSRLGWANSLQNYYFSSILFALVFRDNRRIKSKSLLSKRTRI
jgi:hypothetical protein